MVVPSGMQALANGHGWLLLGLALLSVARPSEAAPWQPSVRVDHGAATSGRAARIVVLDDDAARHPAYVQLSPTFALEPATRDTLWPRAPRRLLLDRAREHVRLGAARAGLDAVGTGSGVVVGIVDSGIDVFHPDLRTARGAPRMVWWIDFGAEPFGFHPELERDYGCGGPILQCGILGPDELQGLGENDGAALGVALPEDRLGHGTLVASLALGNGASAPEYIGVAPEAVLIGARVATESAAVDDLDVLLAARFVFERARDLSLPAVLNLSLGGDMGPHDGTAALETALSDWVDEPGRAIVVAAGNSGTLEQRDGPYPGPFGIHTDVHVPEGATVRVPIVLPNVTTRRAAIYAWLATQPGDTLRVALEQGDGTRVLPFVTHGYSRSATNGAADATIVHHVASDAGLSDTERGIALVLSGAFEPGAVFALLLEGEASVDLWLQSEGDLAPEAGRGRALFPSATRERTVTVPATSPRLIAVGATLNRVAWTAERERVELAPFDPELDFRIGAVLPFSSAGPNLLGFAKPDLVAPGGGIVGALALGAEAVWNGAPNRSSMFGQTPLCAAPGCAQVDAHHGVAIGTSMAAPLVTGAVALLFERDPTLTQSRIAALLQAGAARTPSADFHAGAGELDIEQTFRALSESNANRRGEVSPAHSRISFAEAWARPGGSEPLRALLHLRDGDDDVVGVDLDALHVEVENGALAEPATELAPGLLALALAVHSGQAGERLRVTAHLDGARVARAELPIELDSSVARRGVSVRGGCALSPTPRPRNGEWPWLGFGVAVLSRRRRRSSSVSPR